MILSSSSSAANTEILGRITCWMGLISGVLTLLLWACLIPTNNASLSLDYKNVFKDINKDLWRNRLFSFTPEVFVDIWTPFIFGLISIMNHFSAFNFYFISKDYFHYFIWNFIVALFANLGYVGLLGIIIGAYTLFTTFFCLVCVFFCTGPATLAFKPFNKQESLTF